MLCRILSQSAQRYEDKSEEPSQFSCEGFLPVIKEIMSEIKLEVFFHNAGCIQHLIRSLVFCVLLILEMLPQRQSRSGEK